MVRDDLRDVDVCVVGGGPAGLAVARQAADGGRRVLLVDAGDRTPGTVGTGEVAPTPEAAAGTPHVRVGPPLHAPDHLRRWRARNLGGGASLWAVRAHPGAAPHLRLARPDADEVGDAWPSTEVVGEALDRAAVWFGVPADSFGTVDDPGALPLDRTVLEPRRLRFAPASRVLEDRLDEVAGHELVTVLPGHRLSSLRTDGARVVELLLDGPDGAARVAPADVVLAAGAIENARQLLVARETRQVPDRHDLVGRWFSDHPHARVVVIAPDAPLSAFGAFHDFHDDRGVLSLGHYVAGRAVRGTAGVPPFSVSFVGADGVVTTRASRAGAALVNRGLRHRPGAVRDIARVASSPVHAARALDRRLRTRAHHHTALGGWSDPATALGRVDVLAVEAMLPMTVTPQVRVVLGDGPGRPARLRWAWVERDVEAYWAVVDVVAGAFRAAGIGRVYDAEELGSGRIPAATTGYHHMGGTRMARSADDGVVDLDGRHHEVENLWLAGSSVFPDTAGWANPTLLLVGLALQLGDTLARAR